ncbi:Lys-63-specific deubiquitinase [Podarcis lilfordi]|uniref:Lys-63-specific deubiquitinase n=1 Tax=Podarcis lilfordi TaxID=74358 RepID=A0AA35LC78_9SAUR|nr:Lys-63-specific deubiquitinase [Podarcis lilfordi]
MSYKYLLRCSLLLLKKKDICDLSLSGLIFHTDDPVASVKPGNVEFVICFANCMPADLCTQAMYQMMDQDFVGLIFCCFNDDKNTKTGRILFTCFQSIQAQKSSEYERIEIPVHIIPHTTMGKACLESMMELPRILCQEEQDAYRKIHSLTHLDPITKIHNGAVFTKKLCSQMSVISGPLMQWLEDRLKKNKERVQELQQEKEKLLEELAALEGEEQNLMA